MSKHRRIIFIGFVGLCCWSTMLSACDSCYSSGTTTLQTCQQSAAFSVNAAPVFAVACAPKVDWTGLEGRYQLALRRDCTTDDQVWLTVSFPRGVNGASFSLPSGANTPSQLFMRLRDGST